MTAEREGERILYSNTFQLWCMCSDPIRRRHYEVVLEMHRKRMRRLGFSEAELRDIETHNEDWQELHDAETKHY